MNIFNLGKCSATFNRVKSIWIDNAVDTCTCENQACVNCKICLKAHLC